MVVLGLALELAFGLAFRLELALPLARCVYKTAKHDGLKQKKMPHLHSHHRWVNKSSSFVLPSLSMGINGLLPFLKNYLKKSHLMRILPENSRY